MTPETLRYTLVS